MQYAGVMTTHTELTSTILLDCSISSKGVVFSARVVEVVVLTAMTVLHETRGWVLVSEYIA